MGVADVFFFSIEKICNILIVRGNGVGDTIAVSIYKGEGSKGIQRAVPLSKMVSKKEIFVKRYRRNWAIMILYLRTDMDRLLWMLSRY